LKVTAEPLPERQVRLQIEVDDDRHNAAIEQAYKKLAPRVQIRGFRPGKAPRPLIEKQLGRHRLLDEAMDIVIPEVYREALESEDLTPVAQPTIELVTHEPLVFTATVPLQPVIDLGDYSSLNLPREAITIDEAAVEEYLTTLRRQKGTLEPVDRPAQSGDRVSGSVHVTVGEAVIFDDPEVEYRLSEDLALPGLFDAVNGMKKGEEKQTTVELPEDFQDSRYAGQTATIEVKVTEVKEEKLADLDDAFAKDVGEGFETVEALRQRIRDDMSKAETDAANRRLESAALDAVVEQATMEYPAVLVDHEVEHILEDQANLDPRDPQAQQLYLSRLGKSEEEVKASVREEAEQRLRRSLVLSKFADAENITVTDDDVTAEVQTMVGGAGEQMETLLRLFDTDNAKDTIKRSLLTRRTLERLAEVAGGEPGAAAATEEKAPAKPARRASTPKKPRSGPRDSDAKETDTE